MGLVLRGVTAMRALMTAVLLLTAVALVPRVASAEAAAPVAPPTASSGSWFGVSAEAAPAHQTSGDDVMRTMYVTMGAMTGYMFAVMPVTTTAVTAAVASGLVSMWAYDYMLAPAPSHGAPAQ
jgi:hypothetical protein